MTCVTFEVFVNSVLCLKAFSVVSFSLPAMHLLQQWQLSPLHTSVSVSGCVGGCQNPPGVSTKKRCVRAGRGFIKKERVQREAAWQWTSERSSSGPSRHVSPQTFVLKSLSAWSHVKHTHAERVVSMLPRMYKNDPKPLSRPGAVSQWHHIHPGVDPLNPVSPLTAHLNSWDELRQVCFLHLSDCD